MASENEVSESDALSLVCAAPSSTWTKGVYLLIGNDNLGPNITVYRLPVKRCEGLGQGIEHNCGFTTLPYCAPMSATMPNHLMNFPSSCPSQPLMPGWRPAISP